ncbi:MAG: EamA family transporter [Actinobacteria bacterium]|nr:MAG: EamA family transporter [Actinomycetota bacterium]
MSAAVVDAPVQPAAFGEEASMRRPLLGYALVCAAVALWSVNATVSKVVLQSGGLSTFRLAEVRATGSAVLLFAAVAAARPAGLRVTARELGFLAVFGVAGLAFVQFFYFVGIKHLDIGIALVIQYLAPVLVALWVRFFVHEPVRRRLWPALALSLLGLTLVVRLWSGVSLSGIGVASCLGAACAYAVYILMAEHGVRRGRDAYSLLAWGFFFAAVFWTVAQPWWSFPTSLASADASLLGRLEGLHAPVWLLLAYVVVLGTVVPFVLMITALHHIPATRATVVAMLEPVLAAVVAFAWLGERLGALQILGGLLVLAGIVLGQTARNES